MKEIYLKTISEMLDIPVPVLEWNIHQQKDMVRGIHYEESNEGIVLKPLGFIILICSNMTNKYDKVAEILESFFSKEPDISFLLTLQSLINGQIAMSKVEEDASANTGKEEISLPSEKKKWEQATDKNVPELTDENAVKWSSWVRTYLYEHVKVLNNAGDNITFSVLLRKIYKIITRKYGVNFDEAKLEFCRAYGLPDDTKVSNFRVISDTKAGRDMFDEAMREYFSEERKGS